MTPKEKLDPELPRHLKVMELCVNDLIAKVNAGNYTPTFTEARMIKEFEEAKEKHKREVEDEKKKAAAAKPKRGRPPKKKPREVIDQEQHFREEALSFSMARIMEECENDDERHMIWHVYSGHTFEEARIMARISEHDAAILSGNQDFNERLYVAELCCQQRAFGIIIDSASQSKNGAASAQWLLERRWPLKYGPIQSRSELIDIEREKDAVVKVLLKEFAGEPERARRVIDALRSGKAKKEPDQIEHN